MTWRAQPLPTRPAAAAGPVRGNRPAPCNGRPAVQDGECVLSRLAIAIARLVINSGARSEVQRQDWHQALAATVSRMEAGGATLVDLNETVLERFHEYRTHAPLDFKTPKGRAPLAPGRALLITTAAVMDLVYAEYDDLYMEQLRSGTNVRVQAL